MQKEAFLLLITRYREGKATEVEEEQVINYFRSFQYEPWDEGAYGSKAEAVSRIRTQLLSKMDSVHSSIPVSPIHRVHFIQRFRWVAAAVFILLVGIAYFLWFDPASKEAIQLPMASQIMPGKEGAQLKLSDGRIVLIDSLQDGLIASDGQVQVYKENGQLVYRGKTDQAIYHEIVTDKGRQWSAQLPDGSTVWLNAASSLRYPLQFSGKERLVSMTGEASFNVVHNAHQPFRVQVKDQLIEDIGTEFNIQAYDNENKIVTTVIEGVASVRSQGQQVIVSAGKEAAKEQGILKVKEANTDKAIAWRKGLFDFDGADMRQVGRQLERWYNIEVVYEGDLSPYRFSGDTYRNGNLQEVLKVLELSGVKFKVVAGEGTTVGKLIVLP